MKNNHLGFSLLEIVISIAIFLLFALGIYSGIHFVFKSVYNSRLTIIENGVLNEQVEIIRNMSFHDVGIINGSPSGLLARTVTTTRNGINFAITRTIRNIDDEFDGTIGGTPNDTSPADYKLVQMEIICLNCQQRNPLTMSTMVAPKYLEGNPNNGALFVQVFDANAAPVVGAEVHIVSTSTNPTIDLTDTTDNEGMLRLVDLGPGINSYNISVSKSGYTTDRNYPTSEEIANPVKPLSSVVAQNVTEVSFSIDQISEFDISTMNSVCSNIPNVSFNIIGTKLISTSPDVFKVNNNLQTNGSGEYEMNNLEWDSYAFRVTNYDLLGSIPQLPISLPPGATQPVSLVLGNNTSNSLLINVKDSITQQPVAGAQIIVTSTGYTSTKTTGVGFIRQTDWSGGDSQAIFNNEDEYWTDDGGISVSEPGDLTLRQVGPNYVSNGFLESSTFDLGASPNYVNLIWEPLAQNSAAGENSLLFQLATSNSTSSSWIYRGPDGATSTYYNASNPAINEIHNGERYFRYKAFLSTASSTITPILSDLTVSYTNSCTPPGSVYFGSLNEQNYNITVSKSGYQTKTETISLNGDLIISMDLVAE